MLSRRTKVLIALTGLAPASIAITRLEIAAVVRKTQEEGAFRACVDPGPLSYLFLFLGLAAGEPACCRFFSTYVRAGYS